MCDDMAWFDDCDLWILKSEIILVSIKKDQASRSPIKSCQYNYPSYGYEWVSLCFVTGFKTVIFCWVILNLDLRKTLSSILICMY